MKNLKNYSIVLFPTLILFLLSFNTFSQEQTKKDAIDWLKSKIPDKKLNSGIYHEWKTIITNDYISTSYVTEVEDDNGDKNLKLIKKKGEANLYWNDLSNVRIDDDFINLYNKKGEVKCIVFFEWNKEPDLKEKTMKALLRIAKENNAGQKF